MVNKMTAMVPVNNHMVLDNNHTVLDNNHMVPDNKRATIMALVNKATVQDNKRATIMAPVNKATVQDNKRATIMAPVNKAMVQDNKRAMIMAPVNKATVQDKKVLTTAPVNKATDLVNKAVMIIALVNKDLVAMVNPITQKLQAMVPAMITLKVAAAALNMEEQALPMILMDPETPTTQVTDLVNKVAAAMDLAKKLTIMDLAIRVVMLVMDNSNMESNNVDNRVMEMTTVNRVEGMMTIIEEYS